MILTYPTVAAVLSEPLLRGAKVEVTIQPYKMTDNGIRFHVDTNTAKLLLPTVTKAEADQLPEQFEITVEHDYEDDKAISGKFFFTFDVTVKGREQEPDGSTKLQYDAKYKRFHQEA